ncbi:MAG TPA: hypothetical protein VFQ44_12745 [Streptosporangiaceae bacterium]|nr:hypothetical protein [Streptosporangiaceae bacterium]
MPDDHSAHHHGSHQDLLWSPPAPVLTGPAIDAIFVPTARPLAYLAEVAALAQALRCTLVTLHSGKWTSAAEAAKRFPADIDLIAIDVPAADRLRLPRWETSALLSGTIFERRIDLSPKRNLALMLCHMLGWSRILFLDDDITGLDPDDMRAAGSLLSTYSAVGLQIGGFPDNSVVCHAHRDTGGRQSTFVGGGALAINVAKTTACNSFFPDIYNDDWFFLLDGDKWLQPTAVAGKVVQHPYEPYRNPDRARAEELGDLLAEGIYWLLDQDLSIADADAAHWTMFLNIRRLFIESVLAKAERLGDKDCSRRIAAIKGALGRLALITPEFCERYLQAWRRDRQAWRRHLEHFPTRLQRDAALEMLSRRGSSRVTWYLTRGSVRSSRAAAARRAERAPDPIADDHGWTWLSAELSGGQPVRSAADHNQRREQPGAR